MDHGSSGFLGVCKSRCATFGWSWHRQHARHRATNAVSTLREASTGATSAFHRSPRNDNARDLEVRTLRRDLTAFQPAVIRSSECLASPWKPETFQLRLLLDQNAVNLHRHKLGGRPYLYPFSMATSNSCLRNSDTTSVVISGFRTCRWNTSSAHVMSVSLSPVSALCGDGDGDWGPPVWRVHAATPHRKHDTSLVPPNIGQPASGQRTPPCAKQNPIGRGITHRAPSSSLNAARTCPWGIEGRICVDVLVHI